MECSLLKRRLRCFETLQHFLSDTELQIEEEDLSSITEHSTDLQESFQEYFPTPDDSKDWIRNPYSFNSVETAESLTLCEQEQLIEITSDRTLEEAFGKFNLQNF